MFERDCDELTNWYNKMSAVMSAEDIAKDLSSAVSLIERHSENKIELESRDDSLSKTLKNGQELLVLLQEAPDSQSTLVENRQTISERLEHLTSERERLRQVWQCKQAFFLRSLDFQLFMRDAEQADNDSLGESLDDVEALIKKHKDFEKSLEEKAKYLQDVLDRLSN